MKRIEFRNQYHDYTSKEIINIFNKVIMYRDPLTESEQEYVLFLDKIFKQFINRSRDE